MSKPFIKLISILLIAVMTLSFLTVIQPTAVFAATESVRPYTPLTDKEALALIGWLSDKSEVTDEMKSAGNIYDFLTGKLTYGTDEEVTARISFCTFAATAINKNIEASNLTVTVSTNYLIDYLKEKAGGDIDDGIANEILGDVKKSVKGIMHYALGVQEEVIDNYTFIVTNYNTITSIPQKTEQLIKDVCAGFTAAFLILGHNKRAQYSYVATKIDNMSSPAYSNPDVAEIMDAYNSFATANNNMFAGLSGSEKWNDVDNKELLDKFAEFIHNANKNSSYASAQTSVVEVHCPTDVVVADSSGQKLVEIVNDEIVYCADSAFAAVRASRKLIVLPEKDDYNITVTGTDEGTMDYSVKAYNEYGILRELKFKGIPVTEGVTYTGEISKEVFTDRESFSLEDEEGNTFNTDFDSLPDIDVDITDVVIEEELIEGFSKTLIDLVADAVFNMKSEVDISAYDITADKGVALFSALAKYYPCEYALISKGSFSYKLIGDSTLNTVKKIRFYYGDDVTLSDYQRRVADLKNEVAAIVSKTEGMTDFEKALYIHDYIILNCKYDSELSELLTTGSITDDIYSERYTEYAVLVNGTGICGSYALAYRTLMNEAGVECIYLSSKQMNHAWNMIKLDGEWYHVDCCWDDPTPDTYGRARRSYFLLNDAEIRALNHYGWEPYDYLSDSTKYSDMPRNYDITQKFYDGKWYFIESGAIYSCDPDGSNKTELFTAAATAIAVDGGYVYYSSGKRIYRYELDKETTALVYILPDSLAGDEPRSAYISNFYVSGTALDMYITLGDLSRTRKTVSFDPQKYTSITGISISESEAQLNVFGTFTLTADILSSGATEDMKIEWSSSDRAVASVDDMGNVTANNIGTAVITASFLTFTAECNVTVTGDGSNGTSDEVRWSFDGSTGVMTLSGTGAMTDYYSASSVPWKNIKSQIRSAVIENGVTSIGGYTFSDCINLESVTIPSSVETICKRVFTNCDKLTEIIIPDSVTAIGYDCFQGCNLLSSVTLSNNITAIESSTFQSCINLKNIEIPQGVTYIYNNAFYISGLESVTIPDSVEGINAGAFSVCSDLETVKIGSSLRYIETIFNHTEVLRFVEVSENNAYFSNDENGVLYNKDKTLLIKYPDAAKATEFTVPDTVTEIDVSAFAHNQNLKSIMLPDSLTVINNSAFYNCKNLKSISFGNSLQKIGNETFLYCRELESITLPDTVTEIGNYAFRECSSLVTAKLGNGVSTAGTNVFLDCTALKEIEIPKAMTVIPNSFCDGCTALEKVVLHDAVTAIEGWAFIECENLGSITFPDSLITIGASAFAYCNSLETVSIPKNVTELDAYSFSECESLGKINVDPNNSEFSSDSYGVLFNKAKTELILCPMGYTGKVCYIPETVNTINIYTAFAYSNTLEAIEVDENNATYSSENGVLYSKDKATLIHYPNNKQDKVFTIKSPVTKLNSFAFNNCSNLETLIFDCNLTELYEGFYNCKNLTTLIFEENTTIAEGSMYVEYVKNVIVKNAQLAIDIYYSPYAYGISDEKLTAYVHDGSKMLEFDEWHGVEFVNMDATPHEHVYFLTEHRAADKTNDGYVQYECYCGALGEKEIIHNLGEVQTKSPTCLDGESYAVCGNCQQKVVFETLPATGEHSYKLISQTEGDCHTPPTYTYECEHCKDTQIKTGDIDNGHSYEEKIIAPTCESKGYTVSTCSECDEVAIYNYTVPTQHNIAQSYVDPTCKEKGKFIYNCTKCDYEYSETDESSVLAEHIENTVTVDAKCGVAGSVTVICTVCEETLSASSIDALTHLFTTYVYNDDAECGKDGTKTAVCDHGCGVTNTIGADGTALKHSFTKYIYNNDAECGKDGTKIAVCDHGCDTKDTIDADGTALEHSFTKYVYNNDAECGKDGTKTAVCDHGCGVTNTIGADGTALKHSFTKYVYNNDAECGKDGTKTAVCDHGCDTKDTIDADGTALEHSFTNYVYNNDATSSKDGTKTAVCDNGCGTEDTVTADGTRLERELVDSSIMFSDVPTKAWYKPYIDYAVTYGMLSGVGNGLMMPNADVTRAQFVQILANIEGIDTSNRNITTKFTDVVSGKWFTPAVKWASDNGIVDGVGDGKFDPNGNLTREQMCKMIVSFVEFKELTLDKINDKADFKDDGSIAKWAYSYVYECQMAGLVEGSDGKFEPKNKATRAQIATIMTRFNKAYGIVK